MKENRINTWLLFSNIFFLFVFIFILLEILFNGVLIKWDLGINFWISQLSNSCFVEVSKAIGIIFDTINMIIFSLLISIFLLVRSSKKQAIFFGSTMLLTGALIYLIKELVQRARPINSLVLDTSFAFPSGHATIVVVFFGILIYLTSIKSKSKHLNLSILVISELIILLVSFTRLYLNLHWFTDVLAGIALGFFILTSSIIIIKKKI